MASIFQELDTGVVRWFTDLFGNPVRCTVEQTLVIDDVVKVLVVNSRGGFDSISPAKLYRTCEECEKRVRNFD